MPFSKPTPKAQSVSSSSSEPSSGSFSFFKPPLNATPPTTYGMSSITKSKPIIPKTLHVPQANINILPPFPTTHTTSPPATNLRRASTMTRHFPHLRRPSFSKPTLHLPLNAQIPECSPQQTPSDPRHRAMKHESRCLQYISCGIYVAFEDDARAFGGQAVTEEEELRAEDGRRFSHIIQITRTTDFFSPPAITYSIDGHLTKHLHLSALPRPHDQYEHQMHVLSLDPELTRLTAEQAEMYLDSSYFYPEKRFTLADNGIARLESGQMVAAKEFIQMSGAGVTLGRSSPRILVTAPRDHRTDIMSIVFCFLASAFESSPSEVVDSIDRQWGVKNVWQGCVSRVGVEYIQEVC